MKISVPFMKDSDILFIGATSGTVAAAIAARQAGHKVMCASPLTYPGEDVCATMNYWGWGRSGAEATVARDLFGYPSETQRLPSPMLVKRTLDQAMLAAGVEFLYMTYSVALLRDSNGAIAGAVVANRSGFQAIRASVIVDATPRAHLLRSAYDASFRPFEAGLYTCHRVAVGNDTAEIARVPGTRLSGYFRAQGRDLMPFSWELEYDFKDASPMSMAQADVDIRLSTWFPGQLVSADRLDVRFRDQLISDGRRQEDWSGTDAFDLRAMQVGQEPLFVFGPLADVSDSVADCLTDPCAATAVGSRLGEYAASLVKENSGDTLAVDLPGTEPVEGMDVVRSDRYFRFAGGDGVSMDLNRVPVLGVYDVAVAGGGTGGAPAAISAARRGAETVVLEYVPGLGGVGTEGRISTYYHGNRCGFTTEIDQGVHALGRAPDFPWDAGKWNTEWKKHWYLQAAHEAGAKIWFGSLTVGAATKDNHVCGIVAATPHGFGLIKAGCVVDSTGNADVVAAAGGATVNISKAHVAVQGTGLSPVEPGRHYTNTDYTFVDDTDVVDITRAFAVARGKFSGAFDLAQIVDSRQRQQAQGELSLDPLDFLAERTFPDTVVTASSNFDSHGFTIHPLFMAKPPDREELRAHVPYRCLIPKGLDGILVTGLGVSSHRDALPVIRMQPDVQNQGYAAGHAAAMAVADGCGVRDIDIKALQRHLVDKKILENDVPEHLDSFPLSDQKVADAVASGTDDYLGLAVIFSDPARSLPLLRMAFVQSNGALRLRYALILGLLGDATSADVLAEELDSREWDEGWNFRGMGQFGFSLSEVDSLLIALGRSGSPRAFASMMKKLSALQPEREFSHLRAITLAFEARPTGEAAPEFARLLEGVHGNSKTDMAANIAGSSNDACDTDERNLELKELLLARGLFACGDYQGIGRTILEAYSRDLHGHYARHARAVLADGAS